MHNTKLSGKFLILAIATGPAVLLLYSTQISGPGLSPDSIDYISAAKSFTKELVYTGLDGQSIQYWPPLYPTIISLLPGDNFSIAKFSSFINAMTLFAITLLSAQYVVRYTRAFSELAESLGIPFGEDF